VVQRNYHILKEERIFLLAFYEFRVKSVVTPEARDSVLMLTSFDIGVRRCSEVYYLKNTSNLTLLSLSGMFQELLC
jgi:hypothetical protein